MGYNMVQPIIIPMVYILIIQKKQAAILTVSPRCGWISVGFRDNGTDMIDRM